MFHYSSRRRKSFKKTTKLSVSRLILALGFAGIDTIWSLYMNSFGLKDSTIGFISAILVILTLLFSFYSTIILEKINEVKILFLSLFVLIGSYLLAAYVPSLPFFIFISVIITLAHVIRMLSFDIMFRDESPDEELNENEGLLYTLANVGWLIGPLIAGYVMSLYDLSTVFLSSAILVIIGTYIIKRSDIKAKEKIRETVDLNIAENLKSYFSSMKLILPYIMVIGIEIWWALIYIYMPLFIINEGLNATYVGLFLAAVIIPLVLFEFEVGKYSQKYGFRKFFVIGFGLLFIFSILSFLSNNIYLTLILLILASIAMALIEPIEDSYFFRQVTSNEEEKFYPIFNTAGDLGSFIGRISIAGILVFLPQNFAFLVVGIFMGAITLISLKIK